MLANANSMLLRRGRPFSSAPIRTKPIRTYDPLTEKPTPEGDHVPMMLARLKAARPNDPQWQSLLGELDAFGEKAGLFKSIDVKRLGGDQANLPFQVRLGMNGGPQFNLIDVGYGVSQVLPILVDAIMNKDRMLLLQQPEVHLHPRAQAELGSFLAKLAGDHRLSPIVIETHSDYLLDRIRMDIRDKKGVASGDVVVLYFERGVDGVSITPIHIDDDGNLVDAPIGYRDFFLAEERRFLQG
jgi:predicted ATPase